ncbi:hypothetical protein [Naasia lichenicola]|uniref:DUF1990 family protein n=1 Tax=Naasia lichenicola TaxID=2565933 RepID=A0A4S4FIG3_9MICO|nr:hypothetical protein [Naasia lichenicola]THG30133.1 hypothetical protein E6C64_16000 [Naasia lichenicola]
MSQQDDSRPRDAAFWAAKVDRLTVADAQQKHGYNIQGKRIAGPQQGFGRLWQRTYSVDLGSAVTPEQLVADWRARFGDFWPKTGRFHGSVTSIQPGDVAPLTAGGVTTGIMVLYADATSFSFLTPEGHMFAAMITFSGDLDESGGTVANIRMLLRTSDPLFELMWPVAKRAEDVFWPGTLTNLAAAHGVQDVAVSSETICVDGGRIWKNWRNVRNNSAIRTVWHTVSAPARSRRSARVTP